MRLREGDEFRGAHRREVRRMGKQHKPSALVIGKPLPGRGWWAPEVGAGSFNFGNP